ncbi:hypothetical protein SESBI_31294, partial [Sesbania bispinosa]
MAENRNSSNVGGQPGCEVNPCVEHSKSNESIHEGVGCWIGGNNKHVEHLLTMFQEMMLNIKEMMMRQEQMEHTLKELVKKVDENKPTERKGLNMNVAPTKAPQVNGGPHETANGGDKMDWDSLKLEPFENNNDDLYFVVGSDEEDGYFHDMAIKKSKQKLPTHSANTPRQHITGNSFVKTEKDMFYNMDKGIDLKQLASNFKGGNKESKLEDTTSLITPKKLSFSPSGTYKKQRMSSVEAAKKYTPKSKPCSKATNAYIKTKFKPSVDMDLTPAEVHLSLYIFRVDGDSSEWLIKIGNIICTRGTLDSLCPDKRVDREWDVLRGTLVTKLLDEYTDFWMPASTTLKY